MRCFEQILEATFHKTAAIRPFTSHITNHLRKTNKTLGSMLKKQGRTHKRRYSMEPYTGLISVGRPARTYISYMRTMDIVWRTCQDRWKIRTGGESEREREREESRMLARLDGDDDDFTRRLRADLNETFKIMEFLIMADIFPYFSSN